MIYKNSKISITNIVVLIFVLITAFKQTFSGIVIDYKFLKWKIESLDIASTLPLLFSLINYGHRRMVNNVKE